jgi:NADPH-dependent ferric siderophore reductase
MEKHVFTRVRIDAERRTIHVLAKHQVTPGLLRLQFLCESHGTFQSPSADDHVKIFLPVDAGTSSIARDFTPRAWDPLTGTLTIDFALHPRGPAVDWARDARIGDSLQMAGPRGSTVAPTDFDWTLLIGDSTALPSIARRLDALPPNATVHVIAIVPDIREESYLADYETAGITWLLSSTDAAVNLHRVILALAGTRLPSGDGFIWIAAEESIARGVYRYAQETLAHPKEWIKAAAYWSAGIADGGARIA